jgi:two-component system, chemotaxis family, protein-glutamate methylesterase/glutaminase
MANRDVVVVGASAGGVEALQAMVAGLPVDLPAAVLIVLHVPRNSPSALPKILSRIGPLPARHARDGERLGHGRVYIAPPDHHLLVLDDRIRLSRGPMENSHRPAVDPLFRSAARAFGPRVIGVVLSGARDDGASGLHAIAERGGLTIVQDPEEALHPGMPLAALANGGVDHVVQVAKLGSVIDEAVRRTVPEPTPSEDPLLNGEVAVADAMPVTTDTLPGSPAGFGCPTCGGSLWEMQTAPVPRYRCRVGHAWSPESLLDEQANALESSLWMALRALEEKSALSRRLVRSMGERGAESLARRHERVIEDTEVASAMIRDLIDNIGARGALADDVDQDA